MNESKKHNKIYHVIARSFRQFPQTVTDRSSEKYMYLHKNILHFVSIKSFELLN